jgi:hypothetical protein
MFSARPRAQLGEADSFHPETISILVQFLHQRTSRYKVDAWLHPGKNLKNPVRPGQRGFCNYTEFKGLAMPDARKRAPLCFCRAGSRRVTQVRCKAVHTWLGKLHALSPLLESALDVLAGGCFWLLICESPEIPASRLYVAWQNGGSLPSGACAKKRSACLQESQNEPQCCPAIPFWNLVFPAAGGRSSTVLTTHLALPPSVEDVPKSLKGKAYHDQTFATVGHPLPAKFSSTPTTNGFQQLRRCQLFSRLPPDLERPNRLQNLVTSSNSPGSCP